ncbi:MAG: hypothetical protein JWM02_3148 [Frankiales bacterium]|nr:hypothetical protein [Frankiales bacterium]
MAAAPTLTVYQAADELGVTPARIRALLASGALKAARGHGTRIAARDVEELLRRGAVRSLDVAAIEGALDRVLRRRLPAMLEEALTPLSTEVATTLADVEVSTRELAEALERARVAEAALTAAHVELAALQTRPAGLFRRRRVGSAAPA